MLTSNHNFKTQHVVTLHTTRHSILTDLVPTMNHFKVQLVGYQ